MIVNSASLRSIIDPNNSKIFQVRQSLSGSTVYVEIGHKSSPAMESLSCPA